MPDTPEYAYTSGGTDPFGSVGHITLVSAKTKNIDKVMTFLGFLY